MSAFTPGRGESIRSKNVTQAIGRPSQLQSCCSSKSQLYYTYGGWACLPGRWLRYQRIGGDNLTFTIMCQPSRGGKTKEFSTLRLRSSSQRNSNAIEARSPFRRHRLVFPRRLPYNGPQKPPVGATGTLAYILKILLLKNLLNAVCRVVSKHHLTEAN